MTVFDTMLDTQFNSALAINITYVRSDGMAQNVRAIQRQPDVEATLGIAKLKRATCTFEMRRSEIDPVLKEDTIQLGDGTVFRIMNISLNDPRRSVWTVECAEQDEG